MFGIKKLGGNVFHNISSFMSYNHVLDRKILNPQNSIFTGFNRQFSSYPRNDFKLGVRPNIVTPFSFIRSNSNSFTYLSNSQYTRLCHNINDKPPPRTVCNKLENEKISEDFEYTYQYGILRVITLLIAFPFIVIALFYYIVIVCIIVGKFTGLL